MCAPAPFLFEHRRDASDYRQQADRNVNRQDREEYWRIRWNLQNPRSPLLDLRSVRSGFSRADERTREFTVDLGRDRIGLNPNTR